MLLRVRSLRTYFKTDKRIVRAVDDVSFEVDAGEVVALVGESGSGKTVSAYSVLRLVKPPGEIVAGQIEFLGKDVMAMADRQLRDMRGREIGLVFQEPTAAFDPVSRIGNQIAECVSHHMKLNGRESKRAAIQLLSGVGIPDAESRSAAYPFEFSGGMLQRAMIAMAMSCGPRLLIADEPTTSLDATTQLQIMELLNSLVRGSGTSLLLITHNLGLVARYADRVYIMKNGKIIEEGTVDEVCVSPAHPYTRSLWDAVPRLDGEARSTKAIDSHSAELLGAAVPNAEWVELSPTHRVRPSTEPIRATAG